MDGFKVNEGSYNVPNSTMSGLRATASEFHPQGATVNSLANPSVRQWSHVTQSGTLTSYASNVEASSQSIMNQDSLDGAPGLQQVHLPHYQSQVTGKWTGAGGSRKEQINALKINETLERSRHLSGDGYWVCSIDVECVATGKGNLDRAVARVAMVDIDGNVLLDEHVKPSGPIVSHLTALTGIEPGSLDNAPSLDQVRAKLLEKLPKNAVIVGQAIGHDIDWLGLRRGIDFAAEFDIGEFFRIEFPNGRWRMFSLRHEVLHLEGFEGCGTDIQAGAHDPTIDAIYSIRLFKTFCRAKHGDLAVAQRRLLKAPNTPAFWKTTPIIDGVQLGPSIPKT